MKEFTKDLLRVFVADSRAEMGNRAGHEIAECLRRLLREQKTVRVIFAAAPSQNETLAQLCREDGIEWNRVEAFHMDEYVGLPEGAPRSFGRFLREAIFDRLPFKSVEFIRCGAPDADAECARYADLLEAAPIDVVALGIGENGHIAFNDPPVADFNDPKTVKRVALDEVCRNQQVHDGCFAKLDDVPREALTLTVPTLFRARYLFCSVPAATKAEAVKKMLNDPIDTKCPCTILRRHPHAALYVDPDSASRL